MGRCSGCSGDRCSCVIIAGQNMDVDGAGTAVNPYILSAAAGGAAAVPTGSLIMYGASAPPVGWLVCNGQSVSRTTYADLYAVIGTIYGAGDGSTTFNVPDLGGRNPMGPDGLHALGSTGGALTHTLSVANLASHTHGGTVITGYNRQDHTHAGYTSADGAHTHTYWGHVGFQDNFNNAGGTPVQTQAVSTAVSTDGTHTHSVQTYGAQASHDHAVTIAYTGSGTAVNHLDPYQVVTFIIKA